MALRCPTGTSIVDRLTEDLINEILLWLPLKYLLRCKSVSKSWLSLISNPNFVKSHHLRRSRADETLIVHSYDHKNEDDNSFSLINLASRQIVADLNFPFSKGDFPSRPDSFIVGSACGIVCVCCTFARVSNIYLWNPATKQSKLIPPPTIIHNDTRRVTIGFGFDEIDNDFKVVRIVSPPFSAEVYYANRNAWREIEPKPVDVPYTHNFNVCVNGFLCAPGYYGMNMMAFDLNKEVLNCAVKLPITDAKITRMSYFDTRIADFNDSVAFIVTEEKELDHSIINFWTLDDEACLRGDGGGTEASWTLMLKIDVNRPVLFVHGYFNTGDVLLLYTNELVTDEENVDVWYLYNSDKKEARKFRDSFYCGHIFKYTESLVSMTGSKQVNWNANEDDN